MAKAYLIGGALRIGMSQLTMRLLRHRPAYTASTDAPTGILRNTTDEIKTPDLFHKFTTETVAESVQWQIKENRIVWPAAVDFIHRTIANDFDVVVEGLCVMPEMVAALDIDHSAVFTGNQSESHFETIKAHAARTPTDWLNSLPGEVVQNICLFGQAYSTYIQDEAARYGYEYIEVDDNHYSETIQKTFEILVKQSA